MVRSLERVVDGTAVIEHLPEQPEGFLSHDLY
jgi:hypothetical protein